jgi:hypothetical protein
VLLGLLFPLLAACSVSAAERQPESSSPRIFVIGLSPYLDKSVKDDVYRGIVRLLVEGLPLDSRLDIYDAFDLKTITQVTVPNQRAFNSPKTRANQFATAIGDLKQFLAAEHSRPADPNLRFDAALRLPQFYEFLAAKSPGGSSRVLLLGSPLYQDAREPGFSMVNGYFPSDGHLLATKQESVYGLGENTNAQLSVDWVYFGDPWVNDLYKERVTRFWTLYLARRSARLVSFSSDLPTGLESFRAENPTAPAVNWSIAAGDTKVEMLRISRSVDAVDWLTRSALAETSQRPPAVMVGPLKIGIRWQDNIDLDLYSTPRPGAETLFFQHPRSPEGYYYKDHRSSPGKEFEFIEFETPVDIREVEAYVNFYKGSSPGGPHGEVRIEFDGQIYGGTFSLDAPRGNRGRTGDDQRDYWTRIPVQEILKIHPALSAR